MTKYVPKAKHLVWDFRRDMIRMDHMNSLREAEIFWFADAHIWSWG